MKAECLLAITLVLLSGVAAAAPPVTDTTMPDTDDSELAVILVMGEQPGPGLWKVSSGEHVLWVLGEVSPIPRKVEWRSQKFDKLLRNSQELLLDLSGYWRANRDEMAAYRKAEKLPTGTTLKDVISPELHARVESQNHLLKEHEKLLRSQNTQLDAAINNISQGLCMYDAAQRLVVCNEPYARMYGLSREQVKPGTTLRELVELRIAKGLYAGADPERYLRDRLTPVVETSDTLHELSDGRVVAIARRPMSNGG